MESKITICTPSYNRGYIIEQLYSSLKKQSYKNFEWIIVDDGSNDDTEKKIKKMIEDKEIVIKYFKQKNGGKHRAVNKGISEANSEIFFIVDSDDYLPNYSLERIVNWFKILNNTKQNEKFIGVAGAKMYTSGKLVGNNYKDKFIDTDYLTYRKKLKIKGDKAEVFNTNILKKYRFKEYENENFLTEATLWNEIAKDGYIFRWYSEAIYYCEYLDDGLSKNSSAKFKQNWEGTKYFLFQEMSLEYKSNLFQRIKNIGYYTKIGIVNGYKLKNLREEININVKINKIEVLLGNILGICAYFREIIKKKIL